MCNNNETKFEPIDLSEWDEQIKKFGMTEDASYAAAKRLRFRHNFNLTFNLFLSLVMTLIPLFSNISCIKNTVSTETEGVMTIVQIAIGFSLLLYTSILASAGYDRRAEKLEERGDSIKKLRKEYKIFPVKKTETQAQVARIKETINEYHTIINSTESVETIDHELAQFSNKYKAKNNENSNNSCIYKFFEKKNIYMERFFYYITPTIICAATIFFTYQAYFKDSLNNPPFQGRLS